jgi:hypothetical protein
MIGKYNILSGIHLYHQYEWHEYKCSKSRELNSIVEHYTYARDRVETLVILLICLKVKLKNEIVRKSNELWGQNSGIILYPNLGSLTKVRCGCYRQRL